MRNTIRRALSVGICFHMLVADSCAPSFFVIHVDTSSDSFQYRLASLSRVLNSNFGLFVLLLIPSIPSALNRTCFVCQCPTYYAFRTCTLWCSPPWSPPNGYYREYPLLSIHFKTITAFWCCRDLTWQHGSVPKIFILSQDNVNRLTLVEKWTPFLKPETSYDNEYLCTRMPGHCVCSVNCLWITTLTYCMYL